jgi:hypothetical protein
MNAGDGMLETIPEINITLDRAIYQTASAMVGRSY